MVISDKDQAKKRQMRLGACAVLCVLLALTGAGCDGTQVLAEPYMTITAYPSADGNDRQIRNGTERRELQVEEGSPVTLTVTVQQEAGFLAIWIAKDGQQENAVFDESGLVTSTAEIVIDDPGSYTIWIEAEGFEGAYTFETNLGQAI